MKYPNIVVIGAGQIGSRHLQALALMDRALSIWVVDPSLHSLQSAEQSMNLVKDAIHAHEIQYLTSMTELPYELDAVIVATNSHIRRAIIEQLLNEKKVKCFILEKVLFQNLCDYAEIEEKLREKHVLAWVNCPMRMMSFFQQLKTKLDKAHKVDYRVNGTQLGIGSNAIHHLDLLAYLTNCYHFSLNGYELSDHVIESKRSGFIEFTGTLTGVSAKARISMTSYETGESPMHIHISTENMQCMIRPTEHKAWIADEDCNWAIKELSYTSKLQSQLTHHIVRQLLDTGSCELTTYVKSSELHLPLIKALLEKYQSITSDEVTTCPIT
jgi:predicted dehydrogenase